VVVVSVDCSDFGVASGLVFLDMGRTFGVEAGVIAAVALGVDCPVFEVASGLGTVDLGRILGVEVAVVVTVAVGVDCLDSGTGAIPGVDAWRIFGVEVAAAAAVIVGVDRTGDASKMVFRIPKIEITITIREATVINLRFGIRSGVQRAPSYGAMAVSEWYRRASSSSDLVRLQRPHIDSILNQVLRPIQSFSLALVFLVPARYSGRR
jgi:hypothetical protein